MIHSYLLWNIFRNTQQFPNSFATSSHELGHHSIPPIVSTIYDVNMDLDISAMANAKLKSIRPLSRGFSHLVLNLFVWSRAIYGYVAKDK